MTEIQTPELKGRTRLKGVLDVLVQQSKDEKDGEVLMVDEDVEEGARDLLELNDDGGFSMSSRKRGRSTRSPVRRKGRKRPCREVIYQSPNDSEVSDMEDSHIPHVMTLFDRRVDLALFSPDTPLYVMCREWMSNNPLKTQPSAAASSQQEPRPLPASASKPLPSQQPDCALPPPTPLPRDPGGVVTRLDIPKPHPPHTGSQKELDLILEQSISGLVPIPDVSQLRSAHLQRWKGIRSSWKQASFLNQERYAESFAKIRAMFQR